MPKNFELHSKPSHEEPIDKKTVWSVSEFTNALRNQVEKQWNGVWIKGEIGNYKKHSSGHHYFSLHDGTQAVLSCSLFRTQAALFSHIPLHNGLGIHAFGNISVYPPRGNYSLIVSNLRPIGGGDLQKKLEEARTKLHNEGITTRLRLPIPRFPRHVAVITSETGAAFKDFCHVANTRMPSVPITLIPVPVQGPEAAHSIISALEWLKRWNKADVAVITRGGGSMEDLWAFNDEALAREVANSTIPIVSAIGHEIDFSLIDDVSDWRAPTPSAAAEKVFPDKDELGSMIDAHRKNIDHTLRSYLEQKSSALRSNNPRRWDFIIDRTINDNTERINITHNNAEKSLIDTINKNKKNIENLKNASIILNPLQTLKRGFSRINKKDNQKASIHNLIPGEDITIDIHDGSIETKIIKTKEIERNTKT